MRFLYYIFLISNIQLADFYLIPNQNQNQKICANCKYFIKNKNECSKFGDINIITGEYKYESASDVRNDEDKCGEYGIFYKKNNFKVITEPYYFVLDNFIFSSYILLYFFYIAYIVKNM